MVIASNDAQQQEKIIKYGDLIANAVIFRNVIDLSDVLVITSARISSLPQSQP